MEKISFKPLIGLLDREREHCNRLFDGYAMRYPSLDPDLVKAWLVATVQPLMRALHNPDETRFEGLFGTLYEVILELAGSQRLQTRGGYYHSALMLITGIGRSAMQQPEVIIRAVVKAMDTILADHPQAADQWLADMQNALPLCAHPEQVLDAGRLCAWKAGLAHLKTGALVAMRALAPEVVSAVLNVTPSDELARIWEQNPWHFPGQVASQEAPGSLDALALRYRAGGFRGHGGPFFSPPKVAHLDGRFIATDGRSCCAVFADLFGVSLLEHVPVEPSQVDRAAGKIHKSAAWNTPAGRPDLPRFIDDIRSQAFDGHTLMLTRESSHFLYVFGCP